MGEIAVLSAKVSQSCHTFWEQFGPFVALFAFFALMPVGHMTVGVLLVLVRFIRSAG